MKNKDIRALCEGAVMLAMAQLLGYIKFYQMPYGGSVTLAMVPLIFYAVRWGLGKGLVVSFTFGILQLVLDGAFAYTWQAMVLDYLVAYTPIGLAGLFSRRKHGAVAGSVVGIALRCVAHTLSGVYCWAEYMPDTFINMKMTSPWIYSPIYNGIYMGLNLIITVVVFLVFEKPMAKWLNGADIG